MIRNPFLKNVLTLLSGTVIAQAIPILISPILSRIYTPEDVGLYTIFFATVNIIAILNTGKLELAILLPKHKIDSYKILKLSLLFSLTLSALLFLILAFSRSTISDFLGLQKLSNWVFLVPVSTFFLGVFQVYNYWLNRNDKYADIAKGKVIQGVVTSLVHVGAYAFGAIGLVLGRVLGVMISALFVVFSSRRLSPKIFPFEKDKLLAKLKEHKNFPLFTMPNALLNAVSNNLPLYLLERFYSASITGYYSWSVRIIQGPMGMLTTSIQQVYYRQATQLFNDGKSLYAITKKMCYRLFLIGLLPYCILFFFAPDIFAFVFGENWVIAGEYTSYLVPWFFLLFLNSPLTTLILIFNKQKSYLFFEIILFVFRALALYFGYFYFNSAKYSIILYGVVGFIFNLILLFILIRLSKHENQRKGIY